MNRKIALLLTQLIPNFHVATFNYNLMIRIKFPKITVNMIVKSLGEK